MTDSTTPTHPIQENTVNHYHTPTSRRRSTAPRSPHCSLVAAACRRRRRRRLVRHDAACAPPDAADHRAPMTTEADADRDDASTMAERRWPARRSARPVRAVPADGEGSFGGMADDPAATAASNNPRAVDARHRRHRRPASSTRSTAKARSRSSPRPTTPSPPSPPADLEAVLADTDLLTSILTYHVVAGESARAPPTSARPASSTTVNGGDARRSAPTAPPSTVPTSCARTSPTANATVHIIDEVLMPPADEMIERDRASGRDDRARSSDGDGSHGPERPGVRRSARRR